MSKQISGTNLRIAAPTDGAALLSLLSELGYQVTLEDLGQTLNRLCNDPECRIFLLTQNNIAIGFIYVYTNKSLTTARSAVIGNLVVTQTKQGQGFGRLLVEAVIEWMQCNNLRQLRVASQTHREAAHNFYRHLGFSQYKSQHWFEYQLETSN